MNEFVLAFIPIFVAVDPIGLLPIFFSLTHQLEPEKKKRIIVQSLFTALCLAIGFVFLGKWIFRILGISMGDFMIAGGVLLFCIAVSDLLNQGKSQKISLQDLGAVPLGTPLIAGPAVLTTSLMLVDQHGLWITLLAIFVNIILVGLAFVWSDSLMKTLGQGGSRALSKLMALLLSAIAIMMIRKGIFQIISMR